MRLDGFSCILVLTHGGSPAKETTHADYNVGGKDIDTFFVEVISFARSLSEEKLAIFDLLIRPNIKLNKKEREQVKQVAC